MCGGGGVGGVGGYVGMLAGALPVSKEEQKEKMCVDVCSCGGFSKMRSEGEEEELGASWVRRIM